MLENNHKLLVLGESGASKSTILMEVVCDYLEKSDDIEEKYWALYNDGPQITNSDVLVNFIEGLLKSGKKIIVAVDNAHSVEKAAIFNIIDRIECFTKSENVRFFLTARQPDYDQFCDELRGVPETYRQSIEKLNNVVLNPNFKQKILQFDKDDIKGFIKRYGDLKKLAKKYLFRVAQDEQVELSDEELDVISDKIYKETNGLAIMVRFLVTGEGLKGDVKNKYVQYLADKTEDQTKKIETMFTCCLLELSDFPATDELLEKMQLLGCAFSLNHKTLYQHSGLWNSIHRRWNIEFLSLMFDRKDEERLYSNKKLLWNAFDSVIMQGDSETSVRFVRSLVSVPNVISLDEVKSEMGSHIDRLSNYVSPPTKSEMWHVVAGALEYWGMFDEALECIDKLIELNPADIWRWKFKEDLLQRLGRVEEIVECWSKAIMTNPNNVNFWVNKSCVLERSGRLEEALECYSKAVEANPTNVDCWKYKVRFLERSEKYDEAWELYNKAVATNKFDTDWSWEDKSNILEHLGRLNEALECIDKEIAANPTATCYRIYKIKFLQQAGRLEEALECIEKEIELNPADEYFRGYKSYILKQLVKSEEMSSKQTG